MREGGEVGLGLGLGLEVEVEVEVEVDTTRVSSSSGGMRRGRGVALAVAAALAVSACSKRTLDANAEYRDAGEDTDQIVELYTDGSAVRVAQDYVECGTYRLRDDGEEAVVTFPRVEYRFRVHGDPEWARIGPIAQEYVCDS